MQSLAVASFLPSNVSHKPTPNHQHWLLDEVNKQLHMQKLISSEYLARNPKSRHGIDDAQQRWDRLGFFSNLGLVHRQVQLVVREVLFELLAIYIEHVLIGNGEHSAPTGIAVGKLGIVGIKDPI